ncbi:MAG: CHASE2 domain-containing protein [Planctomycetota bacterium]|nr:CHASE2 domain-containing protein [Planctomycetota bacterium]
MGKGTFFKPFLVALSLVIALCAAFLAGFRPFSLDQFELALFDVKTELAAAQIPERHVVLVDIDDSSLEGRTFPVPRREYIKAIRALDEAGAKVIGFDILFAEPSKETPPLTAWSELHRAITDLMADEELDPVERENAIQQKVYELSVMDIDGLLARTAAESSVAFPCVFKNVKGRFLESWQETCKRVTTDSQKLFEFFANRRELARKYFSLTTHVKKTEFLKRLVRDEPSLKDVRVDPPLISRLQRLFAKNVATMLHAAGLNTKSVPAFLEHLARADIEQFNSGFCEKVNITPEELVAGYRLTLSYGAARDVVKLVRETGMTAAEAEREYFDRVIYPVIPDEWLVGETLSTCLPFADYLIRERVIYDGAFEFDYAQEKPLPVSSRAEPCLLDYLEASTGVSFIQIEPDEDGVVRHWPLFRAFAKLEEGRDTPRAIPVMSLRLVMDYLGAEADSLSLHPNEGLAVLETPEARYEWPVDEQGRAVLRWPDGGFQDSFDHVSFAQLLDSFSPDGVLDTEYVRKNIAPRVNGRIAIIGLTATGTHDHNPVPTSPRYPMVGGHAVAIENMLASRLLSRTSPLNDSLLTFALILVICLLVSVAPYSVGIPGGLVILSGYLLVSQYAFSKGIWLNGFYVLFGAVLGLTVLFSLKYVFEGSSRRRLKRIFSQYLSPQLVEEMAAELPEITLGGRAMRATVYFSDIRGFTSISEKLGPQQVVALLNEYLTCMTDNLLERQGFLDKYIGDAIVAAFGVPFELPGHASRACEAALSNREALKVLNNKLEARGMPELGQRVGLSTGELVAGNVGSQQRLAYTLIGDTVNLGARLEAANKQYGTDIIASGATVDESTGFVFRELDRVRVPGKDEAVTIYELVGRKDEVGEDMLECKKIFEGALGLYRQCDFRAALEKFAECANKLSADEPSRLYIRRCREFIAAPPEDDWDAVSDIEVK